MSQPQTDIFSLVDAISKFFQLSKLNRNHKNYINSKLAKAMGRMRAELTLKGQSDFESLKQEHGSYDGRMDKIRWALRIEKIGYDKAEAEFDSIKTDPSTTLKDYCGDVSDDQKRHGRVFAKIPELENLFKSRPNHSGPTLDGINRRIESAIEKYKSNKSKAWVFPEIQAELLWHIFHSVETFKSNYHPKELRAITHQSATKELQGFLEENLISDAYAKKQLAEEHERLYKLAVSKLAPFKQAHESINSLIDKFLDIDTESESFSAALIEQCRKFKNEFRKLERSNDLDAAALVPTIVKTFTQIEQAVIDNTSPLLRKNIQEILDKDYFEYFSKNLIRNIDTFITQRSRQLAKAHYQGKEANDPLITTAKGILEKIVLIKESKASSCQQLIDLYQFISSEQKTIVHDRLSKRFSQWWTIGQKAYDAEGLRESLKLVEKLPEYATTKQTILDKDIVIPASKSFGKLFYLNIRTPRASNEFTREAKITFDIEQPLVNPRRAFISKIWSALAWRIFKIDANVKETRDSIRIRFDKLTEAFNSYTKKKAVTKQDRHELYCTFNDIIDFLSTKRRELSALSKTIKKKSKRSLIYNEADKLREVVEQQLQTCFQLSKSNYELFNTTRYSHFTAIWQHATDVLKDVKHNKVVSAINAIRENRSSEERCEKVLRFLQANLNNKEFWPKRAQRNQIKALIKYIEAFTPEVLPKQTGSSVPRSPVVGEADYSNDDYGSRNLLPSLSLTFESASDNDHNYASHRSVGSSDNSDVTTKNKTQETWGVVGDSLNDNGKGLRGRSDSLGNKDRHDDMATNRSSVTFSTIASKLTQKSKKYIEQLHNPNSEIDPEGNFTKYLELRETHSELATEYFEIFYNGLTLPRQQEFMGMFAELSGDAVQLEGDMKSVLTTVTTEDLSNVDLDEFCAAVLAVAGEAAETMSNMTSTADSQSNQTAEQASYGLSRLPSLPTSEPADRKPETDEDDRSLVRAAVTDRRDAMSLSSAETNKSSITGFTYSSSN